MNEEIMKIFETHAHLDFEDFDTDRDAMLQQCQKAGVERIINVGVDERSSRASIALAEKYPFIYATVGYHPHDVAGYDEAVIRELITHPKVVALGEVGLDYFRNYSPRPDQKRIFEAQVQLAAEYNKPLVIHDRDAHEDCLAILDAYKPKKVVYHCFTGDAAYAQEVLDRGWFISFTGVITYKNNTLSDVVRLVPTNRFFIETDSPYLTPVPHRGKRNTPAYLRHVIEKIAELKGLAPRTVAEYAWHNAAEFFGIQP
jgi:TatD DNase family protein